MATCDTVTDCVINGRDMEVPCVRCGIRLGTHDIDHPHPLPKMMNKPCTGFTSVILTRCATCGHDWEQHIGSDEVSETDTCCGEAGCTCPQFLSDAVVIQNGK